MSRGRRMRRGCLIGPAAAVIVAAAALWWYHSAGSMAGHLSRRLDIRLPAGAEIVCQDSHGGFHGDGVLTAVVRFAPRQSEKLAAQLQGAWDELPMDREMTEAFYREWEQNGAALDMPPREMEGFWTYRDRYFEQHGEKCRFAPIVQNCTFALFDRETGTLYVLECDR